MTSKKIIADYKIHSNQKSCFYKDKTNCSSKIKKAHSIQKQKILTQLEETINKNKLIYSFQSKESNEEFDIIDLIPVGKKTASVFSGFCDYHDSVLFSPIENFDFDCSKKHMFLISYRAFAHAFHQLSEIYNYYLSDADFVKSFPKAYLIGHTKLTEYRIWKFSSYKIIIDNIMANQDYEYLNYHIREIKPFVPIASSTVLSPMYTYNNTYLETNKEESSVILNVLPDNDRTLILITHFPSDRTGKVLFDNLKELNDKEFTHAISSLMIYSTENTFFSPSLWKSFSEQKKQRLFDEISYCIKYGDRIKSFFRSEINFFEP